MPSTVVQQKDLKVIENCTTLEPNEDKNCKAKHWNTIRCVYNEDHEKNHRYVRV